MDEKLEGIRDDVRKIEKHLEKLNERTNETENKSIVLDIRTKKNCEGIIKLWSKTNEIETKGIMSMRDKIAIMSTIIMSMTAIIVTCVSLWGGF